MAVDEGEEGSLWWGTTHDPIGIQRYLPTQLANQCTSRYLCVSQVVPRHARQSACHQQLYIGSTNPRCMPIDYHAWYYAQAIRQAEGLVDDTCMAGFASQSHSTLQPTCILMTMGVQYRWSMPCSVHTVQYGVRSTITRNSRTPPGPGRVRRGNRNSHL